jgi:hypothetical protein
LRVPVHGREVRAEILDTRGERGTAAGARLDEQLRPAACHRVVEQRQQRLAHLLERRVGAARLDRAARVENDRAGADRPSARQRVAQRRDRPLDRQRRRRAEVYEQGSVDVGGDIALRAAVRERLVLQRVAAVECPGARARHVHLDGFGRRSIEVRQRGLGQATGGQCVPADHRWVSFRLNRSQRS